MEAIESILAQTDRQFDLVVSDNSDTNALHDLLGDDRDLVYIKRAQVLSGIDHGNLVLSEIAKNTQCEYFTLFHDDDLMLPNYVAQFCKARTLFPDACVFGTNAYIEHQGIRDGLSFQSARPYLGPITPNQLLRRYFSHHQLGIAPLPSYIYQRQALQDLRFDISGGKYSDVQWLSRWAAKGPMIWITQPMMVYRLHDGNDSNVESRRDRLRFLAFLKGSRNLFSPEILSDYRHFLYKKLLTNLSTIKYRRTFQTLSQFITAHRYQRLCRLSFYQALINKLITRCRLQLSKKS
jgi:hypothetical protein